MDLNLVVLAGRLVAPPETRQFDSGIRTVRYLVAVRSGEPRRRVDVVPVTQWYPDQTALDTMPESGAALWVAGAVQPRFWSGETDKRSRLEIVAHQVEVRRDAAPAPENHH